MGLTAKIFRIFRYTIASDDILIPSPSPFTDKIDFNDSSDPDFKKSDKEGAYVSELVRPEDEALAQNLTSEKPDGVSQPQGLMPGTYVITGFITNMRGNSDDGVNAFLSLLDTWKTEVQAIKGIWEGGRFGIQDFSDVTNDLLPIGTGSDTIGLIFSGYEKTNDYNRNRVEITLTFTRSRGLDV